MNNKHRHGDVIYERLECPDCKGSGHSISSSGKHEFCSRCHATGKILTYIDRINFNLGKEGKEL